MQGDTGVVSHHIVQFFLKAYQRRRAEADNNKTDFVEELLWAFSHKKTTCRFCALFRRG